jgi:Domain of unknown function (DUF4216)
MRFKIPLFSCKWIENRRGVKTDREGFITVDFNCLGYQDDPFILAKQVFYVKDPANKKVHVVLFGKRRIIGVENIADELEYDHFDEIPPFSIGIDPVPVDDGVERVYARTDHEDGLWVKKKVKKKKK